MVELVELVLDYLEQEQDRRAATARIGGRGEYQLAGWTNLLIQPPTVVFSCYSTLLHGLLYQILQRSSQCT